MDAVRGKLITFEGTEGVGKSTHVKLLADYLRQSGQPALFLREPGGTAISEKIRTILLDASNGEMTPTCEALLYAASRAQLVNQVILPALSRGELVICDRFYHSSIAYQGYGRDLGENYVRAINADAIENCVPDAVVFMKMSAEEGFLRKGGADSGDRLENQSSQFFEKVYNGFCTMGQNAEEHIININPVGTKEEVHARIITALREKGLIK